MKILIVSDSHGMSLNIKKALDLHPDADYLLHLGDGTADLDLLTYLPNKVYTVNGNGEDISHRAKSGLPFRLIEVCGKRIYMCHGHRQYVNFSDDKLIYSALENDADVLLHGHTHVKRNEYIPPDKLMERDRGLYLFNPGSITVPRDCLTPSFGLLDVSPAGILLSHGLIK